MEKMKNRFDRAGQTRKGEALAEWGLKGRLRGLAALAVSLCLALAILPMPQAAAANAWDGTTQDTTWYTNHTGASEYTISTPAELAGLAKLVNDDTQTFSGKTITLAADLNLGGQAWTPIGSGVQASGNSKKFQGTFDGGGHSISGLKTPARQDSGNFAWGLFGSAKDAVIRDVAVINPAIMVTVNQAPISSGTKSSIGGIVGRPEGSTKIVGCTVRGGTVGVNLEGRSSQDPLYIGGLAGGDYGDNNVTFQDCAVTDVQIVGKGVPFSEESGGGIVGGSVKATISNCAVSGSTSITLLSGGPRIYGIAGDLGGYGNAGTVENCYSGIKGLPIADRYTTIKYCYQLADAGGAIASSTESYTVTAGQAAGTDSTVIGAGSTYANTPSLVEALNGWTGAQGAGIYDSWVLSRGTPFPARVAPPEYLDVAGPLKETTHQSAGGSVNAGMDLEGQVQENVELLAVTIPAGIPFILDVDGTGALTRVLSATGRVTNRSDMAIDVTLASVSDDTQNPLLGKADLYLVPDPAPAGYTRAKLAAGSPNTALAAGLAKDAAVALMVEGDPKANAGLGVDGDTFTIATVLKVTKAA